MTKYVIPGYNGFVEFAPEIVFGDGSADGTIVWSGTDGRPGPAKWIGPVTSFKISDNAVAASSRYLKAHGENQRSASTLYAKSVEELTLDLETALQPRTDTNLVDVTGAFGIFLYCIGDAVLPSPKKNAVGQTIGAGLNVFLLGDKLGSIAFSAGIENTGATQDQTSYMAYWGCKCSTATLAVAENENVKLTATFMGAGASGPYTTDLIGSGNHAAQPTTMLDPLSYDNITAFKYRFRRPCDNAWSQWNDFDPIKSFQIAITNNLQVVKDVGAPVHLKSTKIVNSVIMNREVTITFEIDYNNFTLFSQVRDFDEFQVACDFKYDSCATYQKAARMYATGVRFTEMPLTLNPENIIGDSITSLPISGFSIEDLDYESPIALPTS